MNKKVLIIEDDPAIVESIQMLLEMEEYKVDTMIDSAEVHKIVKIAPDLILLDIWMSGTDGRLICKSLKSQEATKDIPIILVSASKDLEASAKEALADDFISKPFEIDDLLAKIVKYIGTAN